MQGRWCSTTVKWWCLSHRRACPSFWKTAGQREFQCEGLGFGISWWLLLWRISFRCFCSFLPFCSFTDFCVSVGVRVLSLGFRACMWVCSIWLRLRFTCGVRVYARGDALVGDICTFSDSTCRYIYICTYTHNMCVYICIHIYIHTCIYIYVVYNVRGFVEYAFSCGLSKVEAQSPKLETPNSCSLHW